MLCEKVGVLGNCKAYAKKAISYIPAIGWAWKFGEFVFLERSFDKDKEIIERQVGEILDYPDPVWVSEVYSSSTEFFVCDHFVSFYLLRCQLLLGAEGTRFTEKKRDASVQFARERGIPELKHHLIPRTKGFTASLKPLKAKCPSILNIQLVFKKDDNVQPTMSNLLHGRAVTGHMYVQRIDMNDVPADDAGAAEFLHELFRFKDRLQDSFHTHGDFFTGSGVKPIKPFEFKATIGTIGNTIFWNTVVIIPIIYHLAKLLFSGELLYFGIAILFIVICTYHERLDGVDCASMTNQFAFCFFVFSTQFSAPFDEEGGWHVENRKRIIVRHRKGVIVLNLNWISFRNFPVFLSCELFYYQRIYTPHSTRLNAHVYEKREKETQKMNREKRTNKLRPTGTYTTHEKKKTILKHYFWQQPPTKRKKEKKTESNWVE